MTGERASKRERVGAASKMSKKPFSFRSWILVLFVTTSLTIPGATALAQAGCFNTCQNGLAQCLQAAQGNPLLEAQCQDNYDSCGEQCLMLIRE
jgi:hypothetical protein